MTVIKNGNIISMEKGVFHGDLAYEGNKIVCISDSAIESDTAIDVHGLNVSAGYIDLHMHGGFGFDFFSVESTEEAKEALRRNALDGVTSVMPTVTGRPSYSAEQLKRFDYYYETMKETEGAECLGVHIEGPYFPESQAPLHITVEPDQEQLDMIVNNYPVIKRVSLAPELPGAPEAIRFLQDHGIATAIGHSEASSKDVEAAIKNGCKQVLHMYSGMGGIFRDEMSIRHPGLIELAYLYDELAVELIANGKHCDETLLKLLYKIKGPDGIFIVTDSHKRDFSLRGDKSQYVLTNLKEDGKYHFDSAMPVKEMLRILTQEVGVSLYDAIKMASYTPARVMGLENRKGDLKEGMDADIVVFDDDFNIKLVIARGKTILNELEGE
ncbi:MAG: amidohydrolase family protein [Erysipelotrichaceae bacterium]|nr:amidohydrolase family protein [Erysipelotrichaceae bacterium]